MDPSLELFVALARLLASGSSLADACEALRIDDDSMRLWRQDEHCARVLAAAAYVKTSREAKALLGKLGDRTSVAKIFKRELNEAYDELPGGSCVRFDLDAVFAHEWTDVVYSWGNRIGVLSEPRLAELNCEFQRDSGLAFVLAPHISRRGELVTLEDVLA